MTSHCCQPGRPRDHSHQLINHIVDCIGTRKPQALYAEYPASATSYEDGFVKITYGKLANAVNRMAWWLRENVGEAHRHEPVAYIGANDLMYPALILGAVKAGFTTLLLSPRNSIAAQLHLLQATSCKVFLAPEQAPPPVAALLKSLDESCRVFTAPSVDYLLQPKGKPFVYDVSFELGCKTPFTIMHTSGSTGLPKPVVWPQSFIPAFAKQLQLEPPPGYESTDKLYEANRIFVVFPPFHAAYVAHALVNAITNQTAIIFPLKGAIPSAHSLSETVKRTKVDAALVVPAIIEEMSRSPELLHSIASRIDTLVYSGGDVPQGCGDIVAPHVPIINFYGSTEGASCALVYPESGLDRKDWKYLSLHPDASCEFRHHTEDMYELFIVRKPQLEQHLQIFQAFPDVNEWRTKDLFRRHPTKSHLWSHCGRADDTVVLLTGEKVNPVNMEQYIFAMNPEVSGVLVVGSQQFQTGLLVELAKREGVTEEYRQGLIDSMWPSIQHVNETCPSHARIARTHIMFVDPERPMARSPKGTIQRAGTLVEYASDLDAMYRSSDELGVVGAAGAVCDVQDTESALQCLHTMVASQTGHAFGSDDNFFVNGMDSLQALLLVREIRQLFGIPKLDVNMLYANPTVVSLVQALQRLGSRNGVPEVSSTELNMNSITSILAEYSEPIDAIPLPSPSYSSTKARVYLLTGSTGYLGSYILETLLSSGADHIYCLNRSSESRLLQCKRNATRGLATDFPDSQVTFLTARLSQPCLGLEQKTYATLLESVTCVIHNAWAVDFMIPLSSYRPHLQGVVRLVEFAAAARAGPSILYVSSVSAASSLRDEHIPELIVDDESAPAPMGYGASKYVAEHLLGHAAKRLSLKIRIARIGQIAGPVSGPGEWHRSEWLPSLVISSLAVGAVPESLGDDLDQIDWIPVDQLAVVLGELVGSMQQEACVNGAASERTSVLNLLNPASSRWQELLPTVTEKLSALAARDGKPPVQAKGFEEWIQRVRGHFESKVRVAKEGEGELEAILRANPAAKLLNFYEDARLQPKRSWETAQSRRASATLASLGAIRPEWMQRWIQAWLERD